MHDSLPDMPVKECWYDDTRPVCTAKVTTPNQDEEILSIFTDNLKTFIEMEKSSPLLTASEYQAKWRKTQAYTDGLVDTAAFPQMFSRRLWGLKRQRNFLTPYSLLRHCT